MFDKSPQHLVALQTMSDPEKLAICRLLNIIGSAAFSGLPELLPLVTYKSITLSLGHGNSPFSPVPYMILAFTFCEKLGQVNTGYELGQMAIKLCYQTHLNTAIVKTRFLWHYLVAYRKESIREGLPSLIEAYQIGLDVGELEYAAYCLITYFRYLYETGYNLEDLKQEMRASRSAIERLNQESMTLSHDLYCDILEGLTTVKEDIYSITSTFLDQTDIPNSMVLMSLSVEKLMLSVLFQCETDARHHLALAEELSSYSEGTLITIKSEFYGSLLRLQQYSSQSIVQQKIDLKRIKASRKRLKKWAASALSLIHISEPTRPY